MLKGSKPLNPRLQKGFIKDDFHDGFSDENITSQYIGNLFDDLWERGRKISLKTQIGWKWRDIKGAWHDLCHRRRNRRLWCETLNEIRPWDGFHGLLAVMQTHLRDYMELQQNYGHTATEERDRCVASAKETLELLKRMQEPDDYYHRLKEAVDVRYPDYKSLITHYKNGGSSHSGDFVAQGNGWVGQEASKDSREGYFEFVDGKFMTAKSPGQAETDRLLTQLQQYHEDTQVAFCQAQTESDADFARLFELLREHLYSWWD